MNLICAYFDAEMLIFQLSDEDRHLLAEPSAMTLPLSIKMCRPGDNDVKVMTDNVLHPPRVNYFNITHSMDASTAIAFLRDRGENISDPLWNDKYDSVFVGS